MKKLIIGNAIVWASLMIISSLIFKSESNNDQLLFFFIAGYFATNAFIVSYGKKSKDNTCR